MGDLKLWYEAPAREWTEALPVGNGRLGAMIFGGAPHERLQLNEDTLWTGGPYSQVNPEALPNLDDARRLIFAGRYAEAEALAQRAMMAIPLRQMSFQPAADIWIEHDALGEVTRYRRSLDLDTAMATTEFTAGGVRFVREVLASPVADVVAVRLTADRAGGLSFALSLTSPQPGAADAPSADTIGWRGTNRSAEGIPGRLTFSVKARVQTSGGVVRSEETALRVEGADSAVVLIDAATSFRRFDDVGGVPEDAISPRMEAAARLSWEEMVSAHVAEHRRLFRRLAIELGPTLAGDTATDRRVAANPGQPDPDLAALYVQYGRYLMIASSRPGTQPANLQGIWNQEVDPPWGSKYTANINVQMNYWLPDPANVAECMEPLLRLVEDLSVTGAEMASAHYAARGWVLHHNTDLWRAVGPIDGAKWGVWPTGGAWLCVQLWDHAAYAGRPDELVRRLYPLMVGATRFILDILVPLPGTDWLVTNPSVSPENIHSHGSSLCAGPAMDRQIIRDLIDALLAAAGQLGIEDALTEEARKARDRLPPDRIGRAGQLQEWLEDWDLDVPEIHHRHVSHLYGLYPSRQIDVDRTPELAAAARRSLEIRGDNATGWGIGWRINLWARLRDGDHANDVVSLLLSPERTYPNMFDAHPPFQIDGNFGGAAGILEMLLQSDEEEIHLLPALPSAWRQGSVRGLRARGGVELDLAWADGRLVSARLVSGAARSMRVRYGDDVAAADLKAGEAWSYPVKGAASG